MFFKLKLGKKFKKFNGDRGERPHKECQNMQNYTPEKDEIDDERRQIYSVFI